MGLTLWPVTCSCRPPGLNYLVSAEALARSLGVRLTSITHIITNRRILRLDTLRSKILVFAILVTLLPTGLTAWISYSQNRKALEEKISQELLAASSQSSREMDVWLKERLYDLRVFASSYEVTENLTRGGERSNGLGRLTDYLNSVCERLTDYEELMVLGPGGQVIATSANQTRPPALPAGWAKELMTNEAFVGEAYWDRTLGKGILVVAVPVQRADGRMVGALGGQAQLARAGRWAPRLCSEYIRSTLPDEHRRLPDHQLQGELGSGDAHQAQPAAACPAEGTGRIRRQLRKLR